MGAAPTKDGAPPAPTTGGRRASVAVKAVIQFHKLTHSPEIATPTAGLAPLAKEGASSEPPPSAPKTAPKTVAASKGQHIASALTYGARVMKDPPTNVFGPGHVVSPDMYPEVFVFTLIQNSKRPGWTSVVQRSGRSLAARCRSPLVRRTGAALRGGGRSAAGCCCRPHRRGLRPAQSPRANQPSSDALRLRRPTPPPPRASHRRRHRRFPTLHGKFGIRELTQRARYANNSRIYIAYGRKSDEFVRYVFIYGGEYSYNSRIDVAPLTNLPCRVRCRVEPSYFTVR